MKPDYSIRVPHHFGEMEQLPDFANRIWGKKTGELVSDDSFIARSHSSGCGSGAFLATDSGEVMIACSSGMLAQHCVNWNINSHITGVVPPVQNSGHGTAMKNHHKQRSLDTGFTAITRCFDPLVPRNVWFNLERLEAAFKIHKITGFNKDDSYLLTAQHNLKEQS